MGKNFANILSQNREAAKFKAVSKGATPGEPSRLKVGRGPAGAAPENDPARITRRR
jgi:hypothetical protein